MTNTVSGALGVWRRAMRVVTERMHHRRTLVIGLAGLAIIFIAQALVSALWRSHIDGEARLRTETAIDNLEDVGHIQRAVELEHALIEEHIVADAPGDMARIEAKIARVRADLDETSQAYARKLESPEAAVTWKKTTALIGHIKSELGDVLVLSRGNLNEAAEARLARIENEYSELDFAIRELVGFSERSLRDVMNSGVVLETHARAIVLVTELAGLVGLLVIGLWGARRVAQEQRQLARVSSLEESNRELDAFAGRVAHDLRNPLGTIVFTIELLDPHNNDARMIERLRRGSRRIQSLIDDLLALARAGSELGEMTCSSTAISARVLEDFTERFGRDADLRHDVQASTVPYSEALLAQAVWNLVENAVKYRRDGIRPEIRLTGRQTGARYELTIADNGCGMSEQVAKRVFEPFYRAGETSSIVGTGLGLSIVKRVVEAQGGTVAVSSKPGEGSTFVLSLPVVATAA